MPHGSIFILLHCIVWTTVSHYSFLFMGYTSSYNSEDWNSYTRDKYHGLKFLMTINNCIL